MALFDRSDKDRPQASPPERTPEPREEAPRKAQAPEPEQPRYPSSGAPRKQDSALIGPGLHVDGEVRGEEDLILDGRVKGALHLGRHQLLIGEAGKAEADVKARKVVVFGELIGNIEADECIELGHTARVTGNLRAPKLRIDEGAQLNGRVQMKGGAGRSDAPSKGSGKPDHGAATPKAGPAKQHGASA